jgi:probable rRNA maturation factor
MGAARLVDDDSTHRINLKRGGVDRATDVLSFPTVSYPAGKTAKDCPKRVKREYDPATGRSFLGDLVVSLPRAAEQAESYGHSLEREIGFLTAHGVLHLCGYDHETEDDAKTMRSLEEKVLTSLALLR